LTADIRKAHILLWLGISRQNIVSAVSTSRDDAAAVAAVQGTIALSIDCREGWRPFSSHQT